VVSSSGIFFVEQITHGPINLRMVSHLYHKFWTWKHPSFSQWPCTENPTTYSKTRITNNSADIFVMNIWTFSYFLPPFLHNFSTCEMSLDSSTFKHDKSYDLLKTTHSYVIAIYFISSHWLKAAFQYSPGWTGKISFIYRLYIFIPFQSSSSTHTILFNSCNFCDCSA